MSTTQKFYNLYLCAYFVGYTKTDSRCRKWWAETGFVEGGLFVILIFRLSAMIYFASPIQWWSVHSSPNIVERTQILDRGLALANKCCCHEYHLCSATHNNHRSFVSFLWLLIFTLSLWIVWLLVFHDPSRKFILPIPIPGGEVSSYYWLRFTVHSIHMFITFSSRAFWLKQK